MYNLFYSALKRMKAGSEDETLGRHIVPLWAERYCIVSDEGAVLDVGAGYGSDLLNVGAVFNRAQLFGIEGYPEAIAHLRRKGISVKSIDLERDRIPFSDQSFDLIVCNQVLEHLKDVFWLLSEIHRVLKADHHAIIGVPNLGSLHNRVALFFGHQPPCIHTVGPHVRAFTRPGMKSLLEEGGFFELERYGGGNFYPFPKGVSRPMSKIMPGLAVSGFFLVRKTRKEGRYIDLLDGPKRGQLVDTPYYRGPTTD